MTKDGRVDGGHHAPLVIWVIAVWGSAQSDAWPYGHALSNCCWEVRRVADLFAIEVWIEVSAQGYVQGFERRVIGR
jgi:hypothetical protein